MQTQQKTIDVELPPHGPLELVELEPRQPAGLPTMQSTGALTPMALMQLAISRNSDIDLDKMERWMALHERFQAAEAKRQYDEAMAEFKKDPPQLYKDGKVDYTPKNGGARVKFDHETLGNISDIISRAMAPHGLSFRWDVKQENRTVRVTCIVSHRAGHREETQMESLVDESGGKNSIQAIGSATTYLQRYTLRAATGLGVRSGLPDDDDGNSTGERDKQPDGEKAQNAESSKPALPEYPAEKFKLNSPQWYELIREGTKTAAEIIAMVSKRATLTVDQQTAINDVQAEVNRKGKRK